MFGRILLMLTLRLTHRIQKLLDSDLTEQLKPTTSKLGDWYANFVPTVTGDLIVFVNEKTLLSVAIPIWDSDHLLLLFRLRVGNLLGMIGILSKVIDTFHILEGVEHYEIKSLCQKIEETPFMYPSAKDWLAGNKDKIQSLM